MKMYHWLEVYPINLSRCAVAKDNLHIFAIVKTIHCNFYVGCISRQKKAVDTFFLN